jgi:hypothetical protein
MIISEKIFEYLEAKIKDFVKTKKQGQHLFTCPNLQNHKYVAKSPTATLINGSDKITCLQCAWKGTFFDVIRLLESDKKTWTDAQITEYLINSFKVDMYKELDEYYKYGWALIPIAKNSKIPLEKEWTSIEHKDKVSWIKYLNNGLNLGVRTGKASNITVIDVDLKFAPNEQVDEIYKQLNESKTLIQNTPHGRHFVFKYDAEILQTVDIAGLKIDVRNDGGQILIAPSKIDVNNYNWVELGTEITAIPPELKAKIIELTKNKTSAVVSKVSSSIMEGVSTDVKVLQEGQGRNSTLVSLGGVLVNRLNIEDTAYVLSLISKNFFKPPLPDFEIKAMLKSLDRYQTSDEATQAQAVYGYLKLMQNDVTAKDVVDSTKLSRQIVDKYLSQFVKEGKAIRLGRGRYKHREKIEWSDKVPERVNSLDIKIPYFKEIANFNHGDIVLLGGKPKTGKTTTSLNIMRQVVAQGIKPHYIYSESGSRHFKIAEKMGLVEEGRTKFYSSFHANPLSIEIEPATFTILDWLLINDKENTDTIFKFFTEEMERKGGVLVIFMQLKDNGEWYAPNMVHQMPALSARYFIDDDVNRTLGHWKVDVIRDPIGNYNNYVIPCEFDKETLTLTGKDIT